MAIKIKFYFDEHMPRPLAHALRERGIEVTMAIDVDMVEKDDDSEHLPYATENQAVMFTRDAPFAGRTLKRTDHAGLVCWTGHQQDIGGMVRALSAFAEQHTAEAVTGQVYWLK